MSHQELQTDDARAAAATVLDTNANIMGAVAPIDPAVMVIENASSSSTGISAHDLDKELESGRPVRYRQGSLAASAKDGVVVLNKDVAIEMNEKNTAVVAVNPMHPSQFPDGGRKAWTTVAGAWCCLFVSFGWINC